MSHYRLLHKLRVTMVHNFAHKETRIATIRTNERCQFFVTLSLFCLTFSPFITSVHSNHDYNPVSKDREADSSDRYKTQTVHGNDFFLSDTISSSSSKRRKGTEERKSNIATSTRVSSNQHGLIVVTILVEIEDRTITPIPSSRGKKDNRCDEKYKDKNAQLPYAFDDHDLSVASLQNNKGIIWSISVEEIKHIKGSDVKKDESKSKQMPYTQLVVFEWKKTKEVNEYVTESSRDTDINNGSTNRGIAASKKLWQNLKYYSGTANCTFLVPLERDDSSFRPNSVSSSALSSLTRTFIVSLKQSSRKAASTMSKSMQNDTRYKNSRSDRNRTDVVLTRRLATLPRKTNYHYQSAIDPVVEVFLHHTHRQRYYEMPQLSGSTIPENNGFNAKEESQPTSDDGNDNNESGYSSRKDLLDFLVGEIDFLWTLLLLFTAHTVGLMPVAYILKWVYCFRCNKISDCAINTGHTQEYDGVYCEDNTHHHDVRKEEEDPNNKGYQYQEENPPRSALSQLAPSFSDKNPKLISVETSTCFGENPRQKDDTENVIDDDNYNIIFSCGDCDDNSTYVEKDEDKYGEPNGVNLDRKIDHPLIVREEALVEEATARLRPNTESAAINSNTSPLSDNYLESYNSKSDNARISLRSSHKITCLSATCPPQNYTDNVKAGAAAATWSSSRKNHMPQISHHSDYSKETKHISNNDMPERLFKKTEARTTLNPPLIDSPTGISFIVNCTNEKRDSSSKELTEEDHRFGNIGPDIRMDDASRSLSKETCKESKRNSRPDQMYKEIERGSINHTRTAHHFHMTRKSMIRKDQSEVIIIDPVGGQENDENSFDLNEVIDVRGYKINACESSTEGSPKRRQETTAIGTLSSKFEPSSSLPPRGKEILTRFSNCEQNKFNQAMLGQSDQELSKTSEIKFIGSRTATTDNQLRKNTDSREGTLKQIQSLAVCKKIDLLDKHKIRNGNLRWKKNISQGSETEESYVSTLPPDSDYVSDDDHFLLFSGCSHSKSQALESQLCTKRSENERRQSIISTKTRFPQRRKLSQSNGISETGYITRDAALPVIDQEKLRKDSSNETDVDSVEVIRVIIPDWLKRRGKRPYSKSNYVADWVPSNELQSMSQDFLQEESWDIVTPTLQASNIRVLESISLKSKKRKDGHSLSSIPSKKMHIESR